MQLSFVIPAMNEADGIEKFYHGMFLPEVERLGMSFEVVFVDDGSQDNTLSILQSLAEHDDRVKVVSLSRNFGKEVALTAGMREACGEAVMTIDADGQQPPSIIPQFIDAWKAGAEIVIGVRGKFEKHGLIAKIGSKIFYKLLRLMGGQSTVEGSTDFRLVDRAALNEYNKMTEHGRIARGLMDWMGFKKAYIDYPYGNRLAGKPSYSLPRLVGLAVDSLVSMTTTPLVLFGWLGLIITLLSGMLGLFVIIQQFIMHDPLGLNWTGPTCLAIFITFLVGLLFIAQAIVALYISHIHAETQSRPLYIINWKQSRNIKRAAE